MHLPEHISHEAVWHHPKGRWWQSCLDTVQLGKPVWSWVKAVNQKSSKHKKKILQVLAKAICFTLKFFCKIICLVIRSVPHHFWGPLKLPLLKMSQLRQDTEGPNNRSHSPALPDSSHAWELQGVSCSSSTSSPSKVSVHSYCQKALRWSPANVVHHPDNLKD